MRVALLSAGPTLRTTFDPDAGYDLRIGVNAAAGVYQVDWWSCGDAQTFDRVVPLGRPTLFTMTDADGQYRKRSATWERFQAQTLVKWAEITKRMKMPRCWSNWSITAGLGLAVDLGASEVDVFGHDMSGTVDLSGHDLKKRSEHWRRVARDWTAIREWASKEGVRITEHQPETTLCM